MVEYRFYAVAAVLCSIVVLGQASAPPTETVTVEVSPLQTTKEPPSSTHKTPEPTINISTHAPSPPPSHPTPPTHSTPPTPPTPPTLPTHSTPPTPSTPSTPPTPSTTPTPPTPSTTPTPPTPAPTPAPAPKPLPHPQQGKWNFSQNGTTCIVLQFAAQVNVTYSKNVNGTQFEHVLLNMPSNASIMGGACGPDMQWVKLSWWPIPLVQPTNLTITYFKNTTTKEYQVQKMELQLTPELFINASTSGVITVEHGSEWNMPVGTSYRCPRATDLNMTSQASSVVATLTLTQLQEEAFRTTKDPGFSSPRVCNGGDVPDVVPIAVGCALGALVLLVLVAYIVGRRRAGGYVSM